MYWIDSKEIIISKLAELEQLKSLCVNLYLKFPSILYQETLGSANF